MRLGEYDGARYWLEQTPRELCEWVKAANEERQERIKAIEEARRK